jgi:hypothetical protein
LRIVVIGASGALVGELFLPLMAGTDPFMAVVNLGASRKQDRAEVFGSIGNSDWTRDKMRRKPTEWVGPRPTLAGLAHASNAFA